MENSIKDFLDIPTPSKFEFQSSFYSLNFNSSNESFSSEPPSEYSTKKNDVLKNFDLLCDSNSKNSEEIDIRNRPKHHKSFVSIIKFLRNTMRNKETNDQRQSIFRRPTEYGYVRGISGLPIKVIKASSTTSARCQHVVKR
jgi:hypothetical protein